jgi:phosphatidylglycerol:prolipoprotein diacylglycerol transferase
MHPTCFTFGPLTVHSYGVMMALGFLSGLASWLWVARRDGRDYRFCSDLLFWIMLAGILGARLAYVAADWRYFASHPADVLRVDKGGLTYYGGFLGAWVALVWFARSRKVRFLALADFVVTSLPLAHAFGRVGCLLNGCCHGAVHRGALSIRYPAYSLAWRHQALQGQLAADAARSLPVYPVQLYEAGFNLLLYGLLLAVYRRHRRAGTVGAVYLLVYPAGRFLLEFLRGDDRVYVGGLSMAQWVSVALFAGGLGLLAWTRRAGAAPAGLGPGAAEPAC